MAQKRNHQSAIHGESTLQHSSGFLFILDGTQMSRVMEKRHKDGNHCTNQRMLIRFRTVFGSTLKSLPYDFVR